MYATPAAVKIVSCEDSQQLTINRLARSRDLPEFSTNGYIFGKSPCQSDRSHEEIVLFQ
ncbi:hypothetical protein [Scytonema millei]|uniref:Uncharacterized protein n=1 Tax=Scytonema millei VB511283 TaxID=1245923 RepID=A0A9X5EAA6_9CYAN|nr:hypothetical protein [Scytonema millei]NHC38156.1 hypothetical protein [Scytonema millei VB511283]